MNNTESSPVEQLWYTWSDVGLSTIHAGFRIRAASPGLTEIYGDRVKGIERNMRYVLPPSTDHSITPEMAPVGLTFMRGDWNDEYLLIHKKYTGEDGVGRQGNFFAHALALGAHSRDFTVEDAIWQWEAPIWKTDSNGLDRRSTNLPTLSINEVYQSTTRFRSDHFRQVQDALQFVIEAYLMRKSRTSPLYIAAPAHQAAKIAMIIAGLTNCLPSQLIAGLTFSTYEPDITRATTEIVGTSWISSPDKGQDATTVLPKSAYLEKLVINCETREHSNLQSHPLVVYNQRASEFAAYAIDCLVTGGVDPLYALRDYAERSRHLDIALFLDMYQGEVIDTVNMDERGIEQYLSSDLRVDWLSQKNSRKKIINRVLQNPVWGRGSLNTLLLALREQAERETATTAQAARRIGTSALSLDSEQSVAVSEIRTRRGKNKGQTKQAVTTLADALALLASSMIPDVKKHMAPSGAKGLNSEHRKLVVTTLIMLMESCLLPQDPTEVWKQLFEVIEDSKPAIEFLTAEWSVQWRLLKVWNTVLPLNWQEDDRMRPLLRIPWSRLGDFLRLGLHTRHPQWLVFPVQELITDPGTLTPQIAKDLERTSEMGILLETLIQGQHLTEEANLIIRLVEKGYSINATLALHIEHLLDALKRESYLQRIAKDLVMTLLAAGYTGSELYQRHVAALTQHLLTTMPQAGQELGEALIAHDFPRGWLVDLYLALNANPTLQVVIQYIYPTPEGKNSFFLLDGSRYLGREDFVDDMIALYQQLLPFGGKMQRLFILLDGISKQEKIFALLKLTSPDTHERDAILQRYGQRYLEGYQQAPMLANMVVANFAHIVDSGYSNELLFTILPEQTDGRYLEQLLAAARLTPEQQIRFLEHYGANYILHYPQIPALVDYISTYITNFTISALEREETKKFFAILTHYYKNLALDAGTADTIKHWKSVSDYFNAPTTESAKLKSLAGALLVLNLPDSPYFTTRLARAFSFCIQTEQNITEIMAYMQEVPTLKNDKAEKFRFLYTLATEAAEQALDASRSQPRPGTLTPYLIFALTMPPQNRSPHFFTLFLDKLLYHIDVSNISLWVSINDIVEAHGLSTSALERWHAYLDALEIWDRFKTGTRPGTRARQTHRVRPSRAVNATDPAERASWLQRLRSGQLPWDKESQTEALEPPANEEYTMPPPHPRTSKPLVLPGDTQYSGSTGGNPPNSNPSAGRPYRTYDE